MFGKKEESALVPMSGYPKSVTSVIKQNLINKTPLYDVDWNKVTAISVDYITIRPTKPFGLEMELMEGTPSKYISAWRQGLGRFVSKDYSAITRGKADPNNLMKYKFSPFVACESDGNLVHYVALVRFIDEFTSEDEIKAMMETNAITFSYKPKDDEVEKYCAVLKVFKKRDDLENEACLGIQKKIGNIDSPYILEESYESVLESNVTCNDIVEEGELNIVEIEEKPQDEFVNEESLF